MTHLRLSSTVRVHRSAADVFAYAADFRRAVEWREEVVESTMSPDGPMRAGTVLREVARIAGRTVVTESMVSDFEPGHRFTFLHRSGPLPVTGQYLVTEVAGGGAADLRYDLDVELRGGWAALAPILRWTGSWTMAHSLDEFRFRLEAAAPRVRVALAS